MVATVKEMYNLVALLGDRRASPREKSEEKGQPQKSTLLASLFFLFWTFFAILGQGQKVIFFWIYISKIDLIN